MVNPRRPGSWHLYPFDWIILGYCLLMLILIALFGRPISQYANETAFYLGMLLLTLLIVRFVNESSGRWEALIRILYPAAMFTFFYRTTGGLMSLFFDQFYDWQIVAFEKAVFSTSPTLYIDAHLLNPWITEILSFCYFSYYLMLPAFLIPVFVRRDYAVLKKFLAAACLIFFISYLVFSLYPVEGPRWHFADQYANEIEGPVFRGLVEFVIDNAAVHGGAMPSSHTGIALAIMMFCFRYYRPFGWVMLLLVVGLALGTVWGRFHYVTDVLAGVGIGVLATTLVWKYHSSQLSKSNEQPRKLKLV